MHTNKIHFKKQFYVIVFTIISITTLLSCFNSSKENESTSKYLKLTPEIQTLITFDTVQIKEMVTEFFLTGTVTFDEEKVVEIVPIFGGNVTQVYVELGDYVIKGNPLAVIKSSEVAEFQKQQQEADQRILIAQKEYHVATDMYTSGMLSERDVLIRKQELTNAEAELQRLGQIFAIHHLTSNSEYVVKAPVSGFVVGKNINREMQIRSDKSDNIFTISGLDEVWVIAHIYEMDISKIHESDSVSITTLSYPDKVFKGTIDKIYNILNNDTKTMSARIRISNKDYKLKPGMFTNIKVCHTNPNKKLSCVSAQSLIFENGNYYVIILRNGIFEIQKVDMVSQIGDITYISNGLTEYDIVVCKNALLIYNQLIN